MKRERSEEIERLYKLILNGVNSADYSIIRSAFDECCKWNDKHPDEREILMYEDDDEIMIADDLIRFSPDIW